MVLEEKVAGEKVAGTTHTDGANKGAWEAKDWRRGARDEIKRGTGERERGRDTPIKREWKGEDEGGGETLQPGGEGETEG